jgi:dihydroorotase
MDILLKKAKIVSPKSSYNGKTRDILISNGKITKIGTSLNHKKAKIIDEKNLHISAGWFDMNCQLGDPGFEYKEDIKSGTDSAAAGGFTGIACRPNTLPPADSKADIEYILNKSKSSIVDVYPIGALSKETKGEEIAEMFDMHKAGAIAFSDGKKPLANSGVLLRALMYTKAFNGLVINFPHDKQIAPNGYVNESETSTILGLKGIPSLAEEIMINRDVSLLSYTNGKLHFSTISSANSVEIIRKAKKSGLALSSEVAAYHLILDDTNLSDFDSNYKTMPPLRTAKDIKALINGLKDGTIDVICSDHSPQDFESKQKEFEYADFGIIGLETAFAAANTALKKHLSVEEIILKITDNPRKILGLQPVIIEEGETANITLFNPDLKWKPEKKNIKSKSKNSPFINVELTGKSIGIINKGKLYIN